MDNVLLDLMICRIPGLKGIEKIELEKKFDKGDDFSLLSIRDMENLLGRALKDRDWDMTDIRAMAEKDAVIAQRQGIKLVSWREASYPPLLREVFDPPALLFYRGVLPNPEKPLVAVVGTRRPSSRGSARAFTLGQQLGEAGIPVVSGLALGIDSMAHRGNIEGKAATVAVLGSGLDMVYPVSNRPLARRILETGGVIFSEYPPGTGADKWHFPARNRIISALARGTVIVEAPEKSGALITARFALDQGRDLWVDKAGMALECSMGTRHLVEDGAGIISAAADILAEWNMACKENADTENSNARNGGTEKQTSGAQKSGGDLASSLAEYLDIKL